MHLWVEIFCSSRHAIFVKNVASVKQFSAIFMIDADQLV